MIMVAHPFEAQRDQALAAANVRRCEAANVKRYVRTLSMWDGRRLVADMICDPSAVTGSMRVNSLLHAIDRIGVVKAHVWLAKCDVRSEERRVRDLSERQRKLLADLLRGDR